MASLNHIPLDNFGEALARCAVGFTLRTSASESRLLRVSTDWEVELRAGSPYVVARTTAQVDDEQAIDLAITAANKALDIAAVIDADVLTTKRPADEYVILRRGNDVSLRVQQLVDYGVSVGHAGLTFTHADGTVETPIETVPDWVPAFRFYRLAQASDDLFEAYRNLFLSLEAILSQLFPKRTREGERRWLVRAFEELGRRFKLDDFQLQRTPNPSEDLVSWFYGIRLQLFHGKHGETFIPEVRVSYAAVAAAYGPLVRLWRLIAETFLNARARGGVLTHVGFRSGIEAGFANTYIAVSSDTASVRRDEDKFSPTDAPVIIFPQPLMVEELGIGRMALTSQMTNANQQLGLVGRIGIVSSSGEPMILSDDLVPIDMIGVQHCKIQFVVRLINKKSPRIHF